MSYSLQSSLPITGSRLLVVALLSLILTAGLYFRTDPLDSSHPRFSHPGDWHKYVYMAETNPFDFHIAPYGWRVGAPALVKILPGSTSSGFRVLTFLSIWLNGVLIYLLARAFGFRHNLSLLGSALYFSIGWATKMMFYYFLLVDPFSLMFITAAVLTAKLRRPVLFMVVTALGVAVKESVIFVLPLYYTLNAVRWLDHRMLLRGILYALPAVAVYAGIRLMIPQLGDDPAYVATLPDNLRMIQPGLGTDYNLWSWGKENFARRLSELSGDRLHAMTIGAFGICTFLLPWFALRRNWPLLVRFSPFLLLVYSQLVFAADTARLVMIAFPTVIVMALTGAEHLAQRLQVPSGAIIPLPLIFYAFLLVKTDTMFAPAESLVVILYLAALFGFRPRAAAA